MVRRRLQSRQSLVHGLMRGLQDVDGVDGLGVNPGNGELEGVGCRESCEKFLAFGSGQ